MIQPSILEYSKKALHEKVCFVTNNREKVQEICGQTNVLYLHLDVVGKYFAQNRRVLMSLDFITVINNVIANEINNVVFTCHFMYHGEDFKLIWDNFKYLLIYLEELKKRKIKFEFYIDQNYIDNAMKFVSDHGLNEIIEMGIWFDLGEWNEIKKNKYKLLLMTVLAGKSGQKLSKEIIEIANKKIKELKCEIIFDGGVDFYNLNNFNIRDGINFVSYSAVWKKLL